MPVQHPPANGPWPDVPLADARAQRDEARRQVAAGQGHAVTLFALRLSPHVFVRPGELRRWEWAEIDWEQAFWDIPPEKMKRRIPLRVPLSRQVQAIILELWEITGGGKYLFPSFRSPERPMSENTVNAALCALGYGPDEMTAHGFRTMADTLLRPVSVTAIAIRTVNGSKAVRSVGGGCEALRGKRTLHVVKLRTQRAVSF